MQISYCQLIDYDPMSWMWQRLCSGKLWFLRDSCRQCLLAALSSELAWSRSDSPQPENAYGESERLGLTFVLPKVFSVQELTQKYIYVDYFVVTCWMRGGHHDHLKCKARSSPCDNLSISMKVKKEKMYEIQVWQCLNESQDEGEFQELVSRHGHRHEN